MATLQEIQQREEELNRIEQQSREVSQRPIPQRKFGTGVSAQDQQRVIQQQEEARQNLSKIEEERKALEQSRQQIIQAESERQRVAQQLRDFEVARKLASRGGRKLSGSELKLLGLSKSQRDYYNDYYENSQATQRYVQSLKNAQSQGLTPIIQQGKIVGFLDEKRQQSISVQGAEKLAETDSDFRSRLASTGLIKSPTPTIAEETKYQSLANPQERVQIQTSVTDTKSSVRGKTLGEFKRDVLQQRLQKSYEEETTKRQQSLDQEQFIKSKEGKEALRQNLPFGLSTISVVEYPEYRDLSNREQTSLVFKDILEGLNPKRIELNLLSGITNTIRGQEIIKERREQLKPVSFPGSISQSIVESAILFSIFKPIPISYNYETAIAKGLSEQPFKGTIGILRTDTEIQALEFVGSAKRGFPSLAEQNILLRGKVNQEGRSIISQIVVDTKIKDPLTSKVIFSQREFLRGGGLIKEVTFGKGNRLLLDLEGIKPNFGKGFILERGSKGMFKEFPVATIKKGEGKTYSFFEIGNLKKGVRRNIERQESIRQFAKMQDPLSDIYKPVIRADIKTESIGGRVPSIRGELTGGRFNVYDLRNELDEAITPSDITIIKPSGTKTPLSSTFKNQQEGLASSVQAVTTGISQRSIPITNIKITEKLITSTTSLRSQYYGTGKYELTSGGLTTRLEFRQDSPISERNLSSLRLINLSNVKQESILKNIALPRSLSKLEVSQSTISAQTSSQIQRTLQRTSLRQAQVTPNLSINIKIVPSIKPGFKFKPYLRIPKRERENVLSEPKESFRTFILKGGKKLYLSGIRPRGKALLYGEKEARTTLRATFGIEKTNKLINEQDLQFNPSTQFRSYRIRKGKRIPLTNVFIQKRSKRLSSSGEKQEIKLARMKKLRSRI